VFLISALDEGECSSSHSGRFILGETALGILWMGGWLRPRAGLDEVAKRRVLLDGNRILVVQPIV